LECDSQEQRARILAGTGQWRFNRGEKGLAQTRSESDHGRLSREDRLAANGRGQHAHVFLTGVTPFGAMRGIRAG